MVVSKNRFVTASYITEISSTADESRSSFIIVFTEIRAYNETDVVAANVIINGTYVISSCLSGLSRDRRGKIDRIQATTIDRK